ncbi:MAG TPA: beta-mannosidase, partial [Clostridiales bacterium]|nr:beta-mannosidase [Clostridiales bacterium]
GGSAADCRHTEFGVRTVELDQTQLGDSERLFAFKVNGVRTFCKGGDWVPADSLYGRISDSRYATLVQEAGNAGFNMLRVWGGGLYERDIFYRLCDQAGILIWHDFMFACSEYPDDQDWFVREVENELEYQTRHLANHPSLALWSGNNENHWGFASWWPKTGYFGAKIYNSLAPAAVMRNCPEIPYWNSSPYGGADPNGPEIGDRHHWHDCMMNPDLMKRIVPEEYDKVTAKFISEYGYIGPSKRSSVEKYFGGAPIEVDGSVWRHHTNTFEADTVAAGIRYHYTDPDKLDTDQYLLYAGLCQGLMYAYSLESFRYQENCWGGLFWMYNDCWGETGWTIIDYYLTRKISYYYVKRALAPAKLILRACDGKVRAVGINDGPLPVAFTAEYGFAGFGGERRTRQIQIRLEPFSRRPVLEFAPEEFEPDAGKDGPGLLYIQPAAASGLLPAILRTGTYRQSAAAMPPAKLEIIRCDSSGPDLTLTVFSQNYAHAVHFNLPDTIRLSDDYFDLLPGESRTITLEAASGIRPEDIRAAAVNT